jgi:GAF domain-containing protein
MIPTQLRRSSSRIVQNSGSGDILLRMVKETQNIFSVQTSSVISVSEYLKKSLRTFTGATWVEIFFLEDNDLCLYKTLQPIKSVKVDETSLPGYVAVHNEAQVVNIASASSFYSNFNIEFHPYSIPEKEPMKPSTVACAPIVKNGVLRLVVLLFNKLDENSSISYFTDNDLSLIEALGLWAINNLDNYNYCSDLKRQLEQVKQQGEEAKKIIELGISTINRRNNLDKCIKIIKGEASLTKNTIKQISYVMKCDGVILHVCDMNKTKPIIGLGMENPDPASLYTKTSEFSAISSREILNISDLTTEPLWEQEKQIKMKTLLSVPIINNNISIGCIEFFRKIEPFSPVDEKYAKIISQTIAKMNIDESIQYVSEKISSRKSLASNILFKQLNSFVLDTEEMYDFPYLFAEIRRSLRNLILLDSCTVYISNQVNNTLWTRQSENCDVLSQPIFDDTLYGHVYKTQNTVVLPQELKLSDVDSYDKYGIVQPLISQLSLYPVVGLISIFRSHKPFSKQEQNIIESISYKIVELFEFLWIYTTETYSPEENVELSHETSPELRFREANVKRKTPPTTSGTNEVERNTEKIKITPINTNLYSLSLMSPNKINEIKSMFEEMKNSPQSALNILCKRLKTLVPCQYAKIFIMEHHDHHLVDIITSNLANPSGLINFSMQNKKVVCIKSGAFQHPNFDRYLDSLGGDTRIESFLAVPIVVQDKAVGILAFANASINFRPEDIAVAEFISLIPKEYLAENNESIKELQDAIQVSRRHKMLQQWCKQVFFVANSTQNKIVLVRDIVNKLYGEKNFEKLLKSGLEMVCAIINSEQASAIFQENEEFIEYLLKKSKLTKKSYLQDQGIVIKVLENMRPVSLEGMYGKENMILVPYVEKNMPKVVIKACNKRDDTLSYYSTFNKEDESTLTEFSMCVSCSFLANELGQYPDKLKQFIKQYASGLNTHSLISTIRTASQKLLDCDRATVFIIEGKDMVVKAQGMENEIPGDFKIPIGKGIIGNVAQTGQTENIKDVYEDPRFNPEMDKKTGYRTSTMLCMPVLDTQGKVIAALQMINKKKGFFDESDEETLVLFSEIISSALQNCNLFMNTITERTRILNILNSIGNFILVFNSEGVMEYSNKSIKSVFGISKKLALKSHYSSWLRENRDLVLDITSVLQNPLKKIQKKSQKIASASLKRARTLPKISKALQTESKEKYFDYIIVSVQALLKNETNGVVLILEDATALAELYSKLEQMQKEAQSMKTSVYGETSLQKCIQKLSIISKNIDQEAKLYIEDIIKTLKQGNLYRTELKDLQSLSDLSSKAISEYIGVEVTEELRVNPGRRRSKPYLEIIEPTVLTDLRDINLDPFEIEDHSLYIKTMLQDLELIEEMDFTTECLLNFIKLVKYHYGVWDNPFHNFYHGFNVMHATYMLITSTQAGGYFNTHEKFAILIASLCHDLEHTGRNNMFEVNKSSHLAMIYNDKSVLENHHSAVTFKILQERESNLIASFTSDLKKSFRKLVIVAILGTDMSKHVDIITLMNSRFKDLGETPLKNSDLDNLATLIVHSADLSHPCKEFESYQKWSQKVCDEFTLQYQEELKLGLPPTEIMKDLDKPEVYYANEFGFLKFAIKPLWDCMNMWLTPHINQYIENLEENIKKYQKFKELYPKKSN